MAGQPALDQVPAVDRVGDGATDLLIGQDRVVQVEVDVLDGRTRTHVGGHAWDGVDRIDIRHVEGVGAERLDRARLELGNYRRLRRPQAADDDRVDGWLAAVVVGPSVENHLNARIPAVEGVGAGANGLAAVDTGLEVGDPR